MLTLSSPRIKAQTAIPKLYTGDGENVSPPLKWSGVPESAQELALVCEDPDASGEEPWVHWMIYGISAKDVHALPEGIPRSAQFETPVHAMQGTNSYGYVGYGGPMPPPGSAHQYFFKLFALDRKLDLQPGLTRAELLLAITPHILAETQLVGTYGRGAKAKKAA